MVVRATTQHHHFACDVGALALDGRRRPARVRRAGSPQRGPPPPAQVPAQAGDRLLVVSAPDRRRPASRGNAPNRRRAREGDPRRARAEVRVASRPAVTRGRIRAGARRGHRGGAGRRCGARERAHEPARRPVAAVPDGRPP